MKTTPHARLGGKRDAPDDRDRPYVPSHRPLPAGVDLHAHCGEIYDQGALQSCSAHAVSSALTMTANIVKEPLPSPSRLFLYYNARALERTQASDAGATIRSAIKSIVKTGTCDETLWPYVAADVTTQPVPPCYRAATIHALTYVRVPQRIDALKSALADGFPFVFGMQVYLESFTTASKTGHLPMPAASDTLEGGHAVLAIGFDDATQAITVQNSLGTSFGNGGYFTMPYAYLEDPKLTYDFWTIRKVS